MPTPVRLAALSGVPVAFVAAGPSAMHCLAGAVDGRLFAWGRNEKGQLGHGEDLLFLVFFEAERKKTTHTQKRGTTPKPWATWKALKPHDEPPEHTGEVRRQNEEKTKTKKTHSLFLSRLQKSKPKNQKNHDSGDLRQRNVPCVVGGLLKGKRAVAAAGGKSHSLVAVEGGDAFAFGSNTQGQCGLGHIRLASPAAASSAGTPAGEDLQLLPAKTAVVAGITSVAAGSDFSAWLNATTGALYTAGCPQYGVLGHGTDNEYNARDSSVKLVYAPQPTPRMVAALAAVRVRAVAAGTQHMLGENFCFCFVCCC